MVDTTARGATGLSGNDQQGWWWLLRHGKRGDRLSKNDQQGWWLRRQQEGQQAIEERPAGVVVVETITMRGNNTLRRAAFICNTVRG